MPVGVSGSAALTSAVPTPQVPLSKHTLTKNETMTTTVAKGSARTRGRTKQGRCFWCSNVLNKIRKTIHHCHECSEKLGNEMYFCSTPCFDLHVTHGLPGKFAWRNNAAWCRQVSRED